MAFTVVASSRVDAVSLVAVIGGVVCTLVEVLRINSTVVIHKTCAQSRQYMHMKFVVPQCDRFRLRPTFVTASPGIASMTATHVTASRVDAISITALRGRQTLIHI